MNHTRESKLKAAELARAYMAGGLPPYQAARKCGFMRVSLMEDAIRELEKREHIDRQIADKPQSEQDGAYLPKASVLVDLKPPTKPAPENEKQPETETNPEAKPFPCFKPLQVWGNDLANISFYGQNGDKKPMYRLRLEGVRSYLEIPETHLKDAAKLMCEAAGLNGPESTQEAKPQQNVEPLAQVAELEAALRAEREAHNALKLKVFDKLFAQQL